MRLGHMIALFVAVSWAVYAGFHYASPLGAIVGIVIAIEVVRREVQRDRREWGGWFQEGLHEHAGEPVRGDLYPALPSDDGHVVREAVVEDFNREPIVIGQNWWSSYPQSEVRLAEPPRQHRRSWARYGTSYGRSHQENQKSIRDEFPCHPAHQVGLALPGGQVNKTCPGCGKEWTVLVEPIPHLANHVQVTWAPASVASLDVL